VRVRSIYSCSGLPLCVHSCDTVRTSLKGCQGASKSGRDTLLHVIRAKTRVDRDSGRPLTDDIAEVKGVQRKHKGQPRGWGESRAKDPRAYFHRSPGARYTAPKQNFNTGSLSLLSANITRIVIAAIQTDDKLIFIHAVGKVPGASHRFESR